MKAYKEIVRNVLENGVLKPNRTGVDTIAIAGAMFEHDMAEGFPLLTTKHVPFRLIASELEFFINGITDKQWLKYRNNHIWDEWASPIKVPYGTDEETKRKMAEESDLGPIYGYQWRNFDGSYSEDGGMDDGVDQLAKLVETLKKNPMDRRMIVSAWNPKQIGQMALPPCHYGFQVTVLDGKLNLLWNQRSVDVALGLPFNIASYGLLLHLLAKEAGLAEGKLVGFLADVHIYINHIDGLKEQLTREPLPLCEMNTSSTGELFNIFDWHYQMSVPACYTHHPKIAFEVAV